jgi:hypothetical protein
MLRVKQIAGILLNVAIFGVLLFGPARTLSWRARGCCSA